MKAVILVVPKLPEGPSHVIDGDFMAESIEVKIKLKINK